MDSLAARLGSRKFLLAVGGAVSFFAVKEYEKALGLVVAYVLAEAGIDAADVVKRGREVLDEIEEPSV